MENSQPKELKDFCEFILSKCELTFSQKDECAIIKLNKDIKCLNDLCFVILEYFKKGAKNARA